MEVKKDVVPVEVKGLIPTANGVAVFLGNPEKTFVIYVDHSVGSAIGMFMSGTAKERPLTHDLMAMVLEALGASVQRVIINDFKSGTFFGRLILTAENELQQRKILEIDARPSDCIALATQQKAPIFVSQLVWDEVEDTTGLLEEMADESRRAAEQDDEGGA
ncbi:MAG: bifunctional nuclease family protein [Terrimicrobiaceae bacterium]